MNQDVETKCQLMLDLNNAIINKSSKHELFKALATEIKKIFKYDRFSINLYDPQTNKLKMLSTAEGIVPEELNRHERPLEHGPISKYVIENRECLKIPDLEKYKHWSSANAMLKAGLRASIACPLQIREEILGSMNISYKEAPSNFDTLAHFFYEISGQVSLAVDNMLTHIRMQELNENLKQQKYYLLQEIENDYNPDHFFFTSPQMWDLISQLEIFAENDASVLVTGETGTGKDYIARCIHNLSPRREGMFIKVSCPSLAPSLFESELFGHSKGAFTGANTKKIGRLEMAHGGTLFLDEIGELPLPLQAKLLQVLQDYTFERVGESNSIKVNFRTIAATNKNLHKCIEDNTFRSDLFYRLETLHLHIPPLRERPEDIPYLIDKINEVESKNMNKNPPRYTKQAITALKQYSWPGNVRELKNLIKRLIILKSGKNVLLEDIQNILKRDDTIDCSENTASNNTLDLFTKEREHIENVLKMTKGRIGGTKGAASLLNVPRTTLQYKLKKHQINPNAYK